MRKYQVWAAIQALKHARDMVAACEPKIIAETPADTARLEDELAEWRDELLSLDNMMHAYRREFDAL